VGKNIMHSAFDSDQRESDAEAVDAERTGRTNAAREMTDSPGQQPPPGQSDRVGEPGEGLDELQGLYANDSSPREHLPEQGDEPKTATVAHPPAANSNTPALWDKLKVLERQTIETPKGEPFRVKAGTSREGVTVSPLDGGQEWVVPAQELEAGWTAVKGGAQLDGLASIRLQEAGVRSAHPDYVAGLLRAIVDEES
jgi:hypothetical protein